ncbi:uncharacterized protein Z520_03020 [Fonsecaea multimorphosa CBS 102226]|uniref:PLD phosphodiesterase domain-containing protein n=1 Tax=Fonsecaea multimorphosa CBS 102226 TaxID=1442371 RepID=A0A0D2K6K5_9EURO|nr:uncharacterized protein Z520_03020 [Fonsecaea multimorphosa CBS 102226]KIY01468.1 hypothetical protein Z520_03020 [Fonsecaea multimorphosa CBS 102226]OAL28232.1 hypothetical protein AYO22_02938 [Fonsecaea multimorphosa]
MPPQIIDLVSDDEDVDPPPHSTSKRANPNPRSSQAKTSAHGTRQNVTTTNQGNLGEPMDPNTPTWTSHHGNKHILEGADRPGSSIISSHTERGSPNPIEEPALHPPTIAARRDNNKGKQREIEIPEIDLSQLDSDSAYDNDDGTGGSSGDKDLGEQGDEVLGYDNGNGELSEDEAFRRAIALSLQEQMPRRKSNQDAGATSSISQGKAKAQLKPQPPSRPLTQTAAARPPDEAMPDTREESRTISLSQPPAHRNPVVQHPHAAATTKMPLPYPGSTPTSPLPGQISHPSTTQNDPSHPQASSADGQVPSSGPGTGAGKFSLANLNRRQMEAERLARRKRKLEDETLREAGYSEDDGRSSKVVKLSQSESATATGTPRTGEAGKGKMRSSQQHPTASDLRRDSGSSRHQLQLPERNNRAAAAAAAAAQTAGSSQTGQRAAGAKSASPNVRAGISASNNANGRDSNSDIVSPPLDTTAPNPTPPGPPCIQIDDDDGDDNDEHSHDNKDNNTSSTTSSNSSAANLYPDGIALKTYVAGHPSANTITFDKVVSPSSQLESCLLSSFIWDLDWLLPHFETRRTKFQLVMQAKDALERQAVERDFQGVPNVRLTFPPMGGNVSCMHSKLMLLFYKHEESGRTVAASAMGKRGSLGSLQKGSQRCRIVIPTANLVDFDWGVGGFMENTVWLIDLPSKSASDAANSSSLHGATTPAAPPAAGAGCQTLFEKSLKEFLRAQTVPDDVLRKLDLFDFRKTERYGFVHSIGGVHGGEAWQTTGFPGLGRTITELGLASRGSIQMDYVSSSIGSLDDEFLRSIHLAASGDNGLTEYTRRVDKRGLIKQGSWKKNFRIYFPSDNTVRTSKGGAPNAGTVCFSITWWNNPKFPRSNMYDCVSVREGLLMHNKLLFVRYTSPVEKSGSGNIGWVYVGSANLSESAWGRLVQDRTTKKPRLNNRNWECGVIIPIPTIGGTSSFTVMDRDSAGLSSINHIVPVPMRLPSESLENKRPWTFSD